jgi:formylmethanofuran dehydrogenase subunit E
LTLIDKKIGQAVRVTPKAEAMKATRETSFFKGYCEQRVPASHVPDAVVESLVEKVCHASEKPERLGKASPLYKVRK